MYISREKLYALGEPFGNDCTRKVGRRVIYGKGGSQSSTTVQSIPTELKPLATAYANKAINLSNQGYQPFTGERYAGPTGAEDYGLNMVAERAMNGDPTVRSGANFVQRQMNAGPAEATRNPYLGPNPYLDQSVSRAQQSVVDQFNNMTKPQTESSMVNSGSFGNSGLSQTLQTQQVAAGKQLGDIASQMYGADYSNSQQLAEGWAQRNDAARQNQTANGLNAAQLGLQYGQQGYNDAQQLMNAGAYARNFDQQNRDFGYQQYQDQVNLPYKQLAAMSGVFGSNLGGTSTTTSSGGGK
ncbi:hypothetical protein UFOVP73_59 [uncultured Caudovirales phage]|uniref:Uncharacterized protein n=1 Tax=uncultured Caudovirales phage TaxID=2100421 RepID=A0A6J7WEN5_9CAUD|nr:hypothetical protein UFOVP73_59 [uncultured Caudovirales phage]CAB5194724.1 hypothetical protein UFOVP170_19 [uncultured Caudovirales phage]